MRGFLKRFRSGMPVSQVVDTENLNRIANILEDIEGYNGIRIEKPTKSLSVNNNNLAKHDQRACQLQQTLETQGCFLKSYQ